MHGYTKILKDQLSRNMPYYGEEDVNTVLEMLYCVYRQKRRTDSPEVKRYYSELDRTLGMLSLQEVDQVLYAVCALCGAIEREAFLEGVRVGAALAMELKDSA